MAAGDRAAVGVQARVVGRDSHPLAPGQDLDREGLVELEQADLVDRQPRLLEHALRGGDRADPHHLGLDARVGEADEPHLRLEPELLGGLRGREQARGRAVGEPGRVARAHAAARAERRLQSGERLHGRVGAQELVAVGDAPALVAEDRHRHHGRAHHAVLPGRRGLALRLGGEAIGVLPRELREAVVQVLGRRAHHRGRLVDQALGDEARVEVDVLAHRMVAHVLDAAGEDDVGRAHRDLARAGRDRGERSRAHAVDGHPRDGRRDAREQRDVAPEREALVADLGGRRHHDVADPLRRELRIAAQHLAHDLHGHVVCARLPEEALRPRLAEGGAHTVDEDDLASLSRHRLDSTARPRPARGSAPSRPGSRS